MLASITRLGEAGKHQRYWITFTALLLGCVTAGIVTGGGLGAIGGWVLGPPATTSALVLAAFTAAVVALESGRLPWGLPTTRRQVNADWLDRYRGVVYGFGFGAQLGTGVATIVTSAGVLACLLAALLSGSVLVGAVLGGTLGLIRGLSALPGAMVRTPADFGRIQRALYAWDERTRTPAMVLLVLVSTAVIASVH